MKTHYREEVSLLLTQIEKLGWKIDEVNNGDEDEKVSSVEEAVEKILETDESHVYAKKDGKTCWLFIVLGNEPGVALADYTVNLYIDLVSEMVYDHFNGGEKILSSIEEKTNTIIEDTILALENIRDFPDLFSINDLIANLFTIKDLIAKSKEGN